MKLIYLVILIIFVSFIGITLMQPALATDPKSTFYNSLDKTAAGTGHDKYKNYEIGFMIGKVLAVVLGFLGVIFFLWTIYAGFLWMTSRGNEKDITRAQNMLRNSIIGLIIVMLAYAITAFFSQIQV